MTDRTLSIAGNRSRARLRQKAVLRSCALSRSPRVAFPVDRSEGGDSGPALDRVPQRGHMNNEWQVRLP
jgi:hypothetical protein